MDFSMSKPASMPATRLGGAARLTILFAIEIGFVVVLHMLGSLNDMSIDFAHFKQWLDVTPPEIALVASIRLLALAISYWILTTSLLYMVARSMHIPGLLRALEITTVPGVRRMIDAGLAASIIGGTVFGGAGAVFAQTSHQAQAQGSPAAVTAVQRDTRALYNPAAVSRAAESEPVRDAQGNIIPTPAGVTATTPADPTTPPKVVVPSPSDAPTTTPTPTTTPKVTVTTTTPPVVTVPRATTPPKVTVGGSQVERPVDTQTSSQSTSTYTVVPGDNFWAIAKAQVAAKTGQEPSEAEVASYWVKLIDANRSSIRSGDPDLIFPGEVFTLPPV